MSALLAAGSVLLLAAALWELGGSRGEAATGRLRAAGRSLAERMPASAGALAAGLDRRLTAAGLRGRLEPRVVLAARATTALAAIPLALGAAPMAPGRTGLLVAVGVPAGCLLLPDLLLERLARRRRRRIQVAMPAALDLMAVGAAAGRGIPALVADASRGSAGPLRRELSGVVAEIECGASQRVALQRLAREGGASELAALATALERSRRHGSPLAAGLHEQATSLREEGRRRTEESAARAAPKIQLVVALLLVPSVLLILAAAILAHSGALLVGL